MRHIWIAVALLLLACSPPRPPEGVRRQSPRAGGSELEALLEFSQLVAVGQVEVRKDEPGGTYYQVLLQEILVESRLSEQEASAHPASKGITLRVTSFLYKPGEPAGAIGGLRELGRFVFFLAPTERPGEWLNLADPGGYLLPDAQETVETLRARGR